MVVLCGQPARAGEHRCVLEGGVRRRALDVELEIVGDIEVEIAVAVEVAEGGCRTPGRPADARRLGHLLEAPAKVSQEGVASVARDIDVIEAVGVEVPHRNPDPPALEREPGVGGRVSEAHVPEVLEEPATRPVLRIGHGRAIGNEDVEVAVIVVVDQRDAAALGLEDLRRRRRAGRPDDVDAAFGGHVREVDGLRHRALAARSGDTRR